MTHDELFLRTASVSILLMSSTASAIQVTTSNDENGTGTNCSLREAVRTINNESSFGGCLFTPGDTVIELGAATIQLSLNIGVSDRVQIMKPLTIRGQGPGQTFVERVGVFDDDIFFVNVDDPGTVLFEGFTLSGSTGRFNSAIDFLAETGVELTLRDMVFRDNVNEIGAAFRIQGDGNSPVLLERVIFEDNVSFGPSSRGERSTALRTNRSSSRLSTSSTSSSATTPSKVPTLRSAAA